MGGIVFYVLHEVIRGVCRHSTQGLSDEKSENIKHLQPSEGSRGDLKKRAADKIRVDRKDISFCFGMTVIIFLINYLQKEDLH